MLKILSGIFGALLVASYLGALHPAGDSLAVFRPVWAAIFALCVIWTAWPRRVRWPLAVAGMLAIVHLVWPLWVPSQVPAGGLVLYQQNLLYNRQHDAAWLDAVARAAPDVITLEEVSVRNEVLLGRLGNSHPAQVLCPFATVGSVAVLSRFAKVPGSETCVERQGLAAMQVETPQGRVTLAALHLRWPWPQGQAAQVERLLPVLEALPRPVVLAGDFNAVGWSHSVRRIARATGNERIGPLRRSFVLPHVRYPVTIDHVLAPGGVAEIMPRLGSDHFGVLARVLPN